MREHRKRRDLEPRVREIRGKHGVELQALYGNSAPPPGEQLAFQVIATLRDGGVDEHLLERGDGSRIGIALEPRMPHGDVVGVVLTLRRERDTDQIAGPRAAVDDRADGHRPGVANALHGIVRLT